MWKVEGSCEGRRGNTCLVGFGADGVMARDWGFEDILVVFVWGWSVGKAAKCLFVGEMEDWKGCRRGAVVLCYLLSDGC